MTEVRDQIYHQDLRFLVTGLYKRLHLFWTRETPGVAPDRANMFG